MRNTKQDYVVAVCLILTAFICVLSNIRNGLSFTIIAAVVFMLAGLSFCWARMRKWRGTFSWAAFGTMWIVGGYLGSHPHANPLEMIAGALMVLLALLNAHHVLREGSDLVRL